MATSYGHQPAFDNVMDELERLALIRSDLITASVYHDPIIAIGNIILQNLKVLEVIEVPKLDQHNVDELERLADLRFKLSGATWIHGKKGKGFYEFINDQIFRGLVVDQFIGARIHALATSKPAFETIASVSNTVEGLVKLLKDWEGPNVYEILTMKLNLLAALTEKKVMLLTSTSSESSKADAMTPVTDDKESLLSKEDHSSKDQIEELCFQLELSENKINILQNEISDLKFEKDQVAEVLTGKIKKLEAEKASLSENAAVDMAKEIEKHEAEVTSISEKVAEDMAKEIENFREERLEIEKEAYKTIRTRAGKHEAEKASIIEKSTQENEELRTTIGNLEAELSDVKGTLSNIKNTLGVPGWSRSEYF